MRRRPIARTSPPVTSPESPTASPTAPLYRGHDGGRPRRPKRRSAHGDVARLESRRDTPFVIVWFRLVPVARSERGRSRTRVVAVRGRTPVAAAPDVAVLGGPRGGRRGQPGCRGRRRTPGARAQPGPARHAGRVLPVRDLPAGVRWQPRVRPPDAADLPAAARHSGAAARPRGGQLSGTGGGRRPAAGAGRVP